MRVIELPPTGLTTDGWKHLPALLVPIDALIPSQDGVEGSVVLRKLDNPTESHCGDPFPHVVVLNGQWYIEDGHHRIEALRLKGEHYVSARVYVYPKIPEQRRE